MKPTIATRFRCSSPLTGLTQLTLMFLTLILQYLNKLVEGKVRDLTTPQVFHTVKVQRFNRNRIKLLTKFACQLPMKVFALVRDLPVKSCKLSDTTPPVIRTFLLTTQCLVEFAKFLQGVFQRLGVLYLLTRAQCQICVFHTEVCPNAFTCCWQRLKIRVGRYYVEPVVPASITLDGNTADRAMPLAVFMKRIWHFIKSPFSRLGIPLTKTKGDTIIFQRPTRFSWIGDRLELVSLFDFRSTAEFLEKSVIRFMNPFQFLLDCLRRQRLPMWVCCIFQMFHVVAHTLKVDIRQSVFVTLTLPLMEVFMHLPHIVKQVTNAYGIRLFPKRVFKCLPISPN